MNRNLAEWFEECLVSYVDRHPVRWKQRQKRAVIELMLRADPRRSDRSLAVRTGFSRDLIAAVREGLPAVEYRTGLDGKRYRHPDRQTMGRHR